MLACVTQTKGKGDLQYLGVSTGMNSLIRPALYGAYHEIVNLTRAGEAPSETATIVGPICETGDRLGTVITSYSIHYTKLYEAGVTTPTWPSAMQGLLNPQALGQQAGQQLGAAASQTVGNATQAASQAAAGAISYNFV